MYSLRSIVGFGAFVTALLLTGCRSGIPSSKTAPAQPTAAPAHLTLALTGPLSWATLPEIVAQEKGLFAAEHLTVDFVVAGQSAAACQQILAKAAEIGECSINDLIQAVETSDAPLVQFLGILASPLKYSLMTKPDIGSWSDLKGKSIIVGGPRDNTVYFVRIMARANGLKDSDYNFTYAGASSARAAALQSGAVDAAILTDPFDNETGQRGYRQLDVLVPKYVNAGNYGPLLNATRTDWAKDHPDVLARYITADLEAVAWIYNPASKQELFTLVAPKANLSQQDFDRLYQRDVVASQFWSTNGQMTDAGVQGVINSLVDLGILKQPTPAPSKFYDMTYVNLALKNMKR